MQPFGRPVARAVLGKPRIGLRTVAGPGAGFGELARPQPTSICLRCRTRAFDSPARLFSSPPPSKDEGKAPISDKDEGKAPGEENSHNIVGALPSDHQGHHNGVKERFSQLMDNLQSRALTASQTLNDLTGYSGIEAIKAENNTLETSLAEAHSRLRTARQAYKSSNAKRAATQREVTTLLARKESWSPADLERFTELYRTDHVLEGEVSAAQEKLTEAEADEQSLGQRLNAGILKRYHEEQIWSDRIRRASTWGTWGLMGMNFLLFVVLQFVAEPWKRRRLVRGVVAEEKEVLEEVRGELSAVKAALDARAEEMKSKDTTPDQTVPPSATEDRTDGTATVVTTWKELISDPMKWKMAAQDLYSERHLDLRMRDASALALEGAVAGAAIAGTFVWMLAKRS